MRNSTKRKGWGHREGQTQDGSRLLYDLYARHVSIAQRLMEDAIALLSLGMEVSDETDNVEKVRVIDTATRQAMLRVAQQNGHTRLWRLSRGH